MTIKEITALRKAGRLEEATNAAEQEFALNANNYTAGALFWCLYEKAKAEKDQTSLEALYERMKSLYEDYCPQDQLMPDLLQNIQRRLDPLGTQILNAIEAAKNGKVEESLIVQVQGLFDAGTLNTYLYRDYGWLIYYALKNTELSNADKRKRYLHNYLRLDLPRPELLHSMILSEAVKVEKNTPLQFRIRDFMTRWGWENLREEDWKQYRTDNGNTVNSLVEKLIGVYAKELKTDGVASPAEFNELVDKALARYPNSQYMPFYKATVLISMGKLDQALDYYKRLILLSPTKCFLWHQASALVSDNNLKIALLCKAIRVERDEAFKGKCRLDLAHLLIEQGKYAEAKCELSIYHDFYISQRWRLRQEYLDLERRIPSGIAATKDDSLYEAYLPKAEDFIYSAVPSIVAVKVADRQLEDRNRPGRSFSQWTLRTSDKTLSLKKPQKYGLNPRSKNGTLYDVKLRDERIVWVAESDQNPLALDWIKKVEGIITLKTDKNGNPYAILDRVYIGRKLLNGIHDQQMVQAIALKQEDGRWSAIAVR